jgi:exodeoxyribonuclease V gamma subunit
MPLQILHSNRVENLHEHLARRIREPHPDSTPLEGETILLDNLVLGSWINLQLALKNSIAANIRYLQSSDLFWELSRSLVSENIPLQTPLSKAEMTWRLMALLETPGVLNRAQLEPVRNYLADENVDRFTDLKRYQLSASVADLYDQYLIYRPVWINEYWDRGKPLSGRERPVSWQLAEAWQRDLWREISSRTDAMAGLQHRAAIQQKLLAKLAGEPDTNGLKFRRLFVFGVTSMPVLQLETLMMLAQHMDVYLYLFNPCELEWFGIRTAGQIIRQEQQQDYLEIGNPLLAGQAGQVRDFIRLVYDSFDRYLEHSEIHDEQLFQAPEEGSLLTGIQREILDLNYRGEVAQLAVESGNPRPLPEQERKPGNVPSIHIHNCHSPLREVEVLHDQLLDMFRRDKSLKPRDVVVMMPRVAPYVPYIDAVFKSGAPGRQIDYHISDRTLQEESPLLNSLDTLLKLPDSRMPLTEVLGLLELPAVHRRFGFDREGFEQLKVWLVDAGVRWGMDANHRRELGLPAYSDFSWLFGLNRLLAGYAMQTRVEIDDEGDITGLLEMASADASTFSILPLDEVEGGSAGLLDGFLRFWRSLTNYRRLLGRKRKPLAWKETLDGLLDAFYQPEEDEWRALNAMRRGVGELELASRMKWYDDELSLEVVRNVLQPVLQQLSRGRHPWSEGVKFCSLLPMRSVPFRVVYLLGMNMDDYPRRTDPQSFDLMRNEYRPGDRSARMDDRWLFLEALLSARQIFHVSYLGQDMHRNEKREPSVVLSELIDYIRHGYETGDAFQGSELKVNSFLYTKHPLQPFSPAYFQPNTAEKAGRCFSFNRQAYAVAIGQADARQDSDVAAGGSERWFKSAAPEGSDVVEVGLDDFVRFFTRPWDWFFRKHGVWFSRPEDELSDEEMFELPYEMACWSRSTAPIFPLMKTAI